MKWKQFSAYIVILCTFLCASTSASEKTCLGSCKCEYNVENPTIRCDYSGLEHFPLPITLPHTGYHFLSLVCNNVKTVPDLKLIRKAFPDIRGVDFQGNRNLNCSSLDQFHGQIAYLSDCKSNPTQCNHPKNTLKETASVRFLRESYEKIARTSEKVKNAIVTFTGAVLKQFSMIIR